MPSFVCFHLLSRAASNSSQRWCGSGFVGCAGGDPVVIKDLDIVHRRSPEHVERLLAVSCTEPPRVVPMAPTNSVCCPASHPPRTRQTPRPIAAKARSLHPARYGPLTNTTSGVAMADRRCLCLRIRTDLALVGACVSYHFWLARTESAPSSRGNGRRPILPACSERSRSSLFRSARR